ncbi:ABC transporter substrate-binding protein [Jiangella alkaliphila]|uniref:NitT/TauT family transport system substrate-binding protein n=1 Tax=Jiangella alkaliphila TaxID=419479 RepID=A0A1H2L5F8_9ACTN|nr:ABC transporter substrate-binding protein [Jiangella alkaliphila]SDU76032.1 NitT/TauT family transport system substrate-binding protein [Jiangella alkaliphila]
MRRSLLATSAVALLVLSACGGDDEPTAAGDGDDGELTEVTLTLNWVPYGEHAPFYYGVAEGIYEEEGIDLEIRPGSGSGTTVQQVAQSQTDFGWADTPPLLNGVTEGMPIKSLGVFLQTGPASVEFFADQGISEPADLVDKIVAGTPGDAMYATFPAWLELNGVNPDDVEVVNVDPAGKIAALVEGRADAIMGFFHDQGPTIEDISGQEVDALLFTDWGMNLLGTGIIAHQNTIDDNPELAEAFVRATARSWEAAAEDLDAAAAAMEEGADETPPAEVLRAQLEESIGLLRLDEAGTPGVNTEEQWQETIDLLSEAGSLTDPGDPATYWESSFGEAE